MRQLCAGILACALMAFAAACSSSDSSSESGDEGGTGSPATATTTVDGPLAEELVVGSTEEPVDLDPQRSENDARNAVLWRVYEALYDFGADGELVPVLAAELPERVNPKTWEVKLASGVEFSNGTPFDADAAVFAIERMIDPEYGTQFSTSFESIDSVEKVDDSTLRINLKRPDFLLPNRLAVLKMVPPGAKFVKDPIGTGPYMLESYEPGGSAELVVNPSYRGEPPSLKRVTIRFIPDANTRLQALQAGEVDLALGIGPNQVGKVPHVIEASLPTATGIIRVNAIKGVLADARVRQALNLAVDKEAVAEDLFGGYAEPATCQPAPPHIAGTDEELEPYPYDPEEATRLVKEAGAEGKTVVYSGTSGVFPQDRDLAQVLTAYWEAIGLKVDLKIKTYDGFVKDIYAKGADAPELLFSLTDNGLGHVERQITSYLSDPSSEASVSAYDDDEVNELFEAAKTEVDDAKREGLFNDIMRRTCDEAALVYIYHSNGILAASRPIEYTPRPTLISNLYFDEMKVSSE